MNPATKHHTQVTSGGMTCWEAKYATKRGVRWEDYDTCRTCGLEYPKSEMGKYKGSYYCYRFGHFQDQIEDERKRRSK